MLVASDKQMIRELEMRLSERIPRSLNLELVNIGDQSSQTDKKVTPIRSGSPRRCDCHGILSNIESVLDLQDKNDRLKSKLSRALMVIDSLKSKVSILKKENSDLETQNRTLRGERTEAHVLKHKLLRELQDAQGLNTSGNFAETLYQERVTTLEERCHRAEQTLNKYRTETQEGNQRMREEMEEKLRRAASKLARANDKLEAQKNELEKCKAAVSAREEKLVETIELLKLTNQQLEEEKDALLARLDYQNEQYQALHEDYGRYRKRTMTILAKLKAENMKLRKSAHISHEEDDFELIDVLQELESVKADNEELKQKNEELKDAVDQFVSASDDAERSEVKRASLVASENSAGSSFDDVIVSLRKENESLRKMVLNYKLTRDPPLTPTKRQQTSPPKGFKSLVDFSSDSLLFASRLSELEADNVLMKQKLAEHDEFYKSKK